MQSDTIAANLILLYGKAAHIKTVPCRDSLSLHLVGGHTPVLQFSSWCCMMQETDVPWPSEQRSALFCGAGFRVPCAQGHRLLPAGGDHGQGWVITHHTVGQNPTSLSSIAHLWRIKVITHRHLTYHQSNPNRAPPHEIIPTVMTDNFNLLLSSIATDADYGLDLYCLRSTYVCLSGTATSEGD